MKPGNKIRNLIFVIITLLLQFAGGMALVFILSIVFQGLDIRQRGGWMISILLVWAGFTSGIFLVGWISQRIRHPASQSRAGLRLITTLIGTGFPVAILLIIGLLLDFNDPLAVENILLGGWQPDLLQIALGLGIIGFYVPNWMGLESSASGTSSA